MAELLDPTEIFYTAYEPKMANRFIMYLEGIPSYLIKAASRPSIDQGEVILDHINVEEWTLNGAFISSATFGDMDWATEDPLQIELTLKYDYAVLQF